VDAKSEASKARDAAEARLDRVSWGKNHGFQWSLSEDDDELWYF
jgi:hypothetical protein